MKTSMYMYADCTESAHLRIINSTMYSIIIPWVLTMMIQTISSWECMSTTGLLASSTVVFVVAQNSRQSGNSGETSLDTSLRLGCRVIS